MGFYDTIIIIIIILKRCSLTRDKLTALYKHLITKTILTYISNNQNINFVPSVNFTNVNAQGKLGCFVHPCTHSLLQYSTTN